MSTPFSNPYASLTDPQQVEVEDRPVPKIKNPTDVVLKVTSTALCGSDLHFYRGHLKCPPNFVCGHEFVGEIVEKGDSVSKFQVGDKVCCEAYNPPLRWMGWERGRQDRLM